MHVLVAREPISPAGLGARRHRGHAADVPHARRLARRRRRRPRLDGIAAFGQPLRQLPQYGAAFFDNQNLLRGYGCSRSFHDQPCYLFRQTDCQAEIVNNTFVFAKIDGSTGQTVPLQRVRTTCPTYAPQRFRREVRRRLSACVTHPHQPAERLADTTTHNTYGAHEKRRRPNAASPMYLSRVIFGELRGVQQRGRWKKLVLLNGHGEARSWVRVGRRNRPDNASEPEDFGMLLLLGWRLRRVAAGRCRQYETEFDPGVDGQWRLDPEERARVGDVLSLSLLPLWLAERPVPDRESKRKPGGTHGHPQRCIESAPLWTEQAACLSTARPAGRNSLRPRLRRSAQALRAKARPLTRWSVRSDASRRPRARAHDGPRTGPAPAGSRHRPCRRYW